MSKEDVSFSPASPRYVLTLKLGDTLSCLGLEPVTRTMDKEQNCHVLSALGVTVRVYTPYKIEIQLGDGFKHKCSGEMDAKQFLIQRLFK